MNSMYLICPPNPSDLLVKMIQGATKSYDVVTINNKNDLPDLRNKRILFALELGDVGYNVDMYNVISSLWHRGKDALSGSTGAVITHSNNELFTKSGAQDIVFHANKLGCRFPGRPIVEATGSLRNLLTMQKTMKGSLEDICIKLCEKLSKVLMSDTPTPVEDPNILVLHSSNRKTSNTLNLWDMVRKHLDTEKIEEINITNGTVKDCIGCPYKTCKHYGNQTSCFYGGIIVEEVYPAVLKSDAIIWICPNYNDGLSANIAAIINRLTALFRKTKFYNKSIFGIIVSGNSGSDALARQLISALNMNKTFRLPPYFSLTATANDKGAIFDVPDIEKKAKIFAKNISKEIKA
ncbi:flavodoxin family protein [Clostridiisalibacter paucivorans]|uniref:flavodoxin family protein n=1 Tax=Clostridiisalibacter paucivorans TaxID=408753 RepID=UPI00047D20E4|nr:NAD(P)H-dependent oxidoreductase [Clostridiisalibacter paucivorans]